MFGNLISNELLKGLIDAHAIDIDPFEDSLLKATHYTLLPGRVLRRQSNGKWVGDHVFTEKDRCELTPNEYVVVEAKQRVRIHSRGVVGRFITTSSHIEGGLLVVAGQIDHKYGTDGEMLRFGVKNLLDAPNSISRDTRLVHVEFFDLRGLAMKTAPLPSKERELWQGRRRAPDGDGPDYDKA